MQKQLPLRARGLLALLYSLHPQTLSKEDIYAKCDETPKYLDYCVDELCTAGYIRSVDDLRVSAPARSQYGTSLKERIYLVQHAQGMHRNLDIIAWFYTEEGIDFTSDSSLRKRILLDYDVAKKIALWDTQDMMNAYIVLKARDDKNFLKLEDIHIYLTEKSSGKKYEPTRKVTVTSQ